MVVVPEPAVKCRGSFAAGGVDGAVGPAGEHGADEALCFAVGLWPVGAGTEMTDAEPPARESVDGGAVGGAVVGDEPFDGDPVAAVKGDGAAEESDRSCRFLVGEHLGVSEAAVVVDCDVDVLPADGVADPAGGVGALWVVGRAAVTADSLACTTYDAAELLNVDVDELARPRALIGDRLLKADP